MFIEYATRVKVDLLPDSFDYFEAALVGFEAYSFNRSKRMLGMKADEIINSVRGPMNALGFLPGGYGIAAEIYNTKGTIDQIQIKGIVQRIFKIRSDGPQFINKKMFKEVFGRETDFALQRVFNNVKPPKD